MPRTLLTVAAACALVFSVSAPMTHASADTQTNEGRFHKTAATRLIDTRLSSGPVAKGGSLRVPVAGTSGVPAVGVKAAVVNITAIDTSATGWITAYATGQAKPWTSAVNFERGWTGATTATVPVGSDGSITLSLGNASANVAVDLIGYYSTAADTTELGSLALIADGFRLSDTRQTTGPVPGGATMVQTFRWDNPIAKPTSVAVNLTAVKPEAYGWLTAYSGATVPKTSSVNFTTGRTVANYTIVPVTDLGGGTYGFSVHNGSAGATDVVVDLLAAYYDNPNGLGFVYNNVAPRRIIDTRVGIGAPKAPIGPDSVLVTAPPADLYGQFTLGFTGTITGVKPTANTYITQYSGMNADPGTSNLNLVAGQNQSNGFGTTSRIDDQNKRYLSLYNQSGSVDVVEDVTGRFDASPELIANWPNLPGLTQPAKGFSAAAPRIVR